MTKLYIPTAQEFKDTFKLDAGYKIPKATLKQYAMYVKGSNLLYLELSKFTEKKSMTIIFKNKKEKIAVRETDKRGWRNFISPLGTRMKLECSYENGSIRNGKPDTTPFWTYNKFKDGDNRMVTYMAYNHLQNELNKIKSKYASKYRLQMTWRNMVNEYGLRSASDFMNPIWLDGCDYMNKLEVITPKGLSEFIGDYVIKQTITNRNNIWMGDILPAVQKIIGKQEREEFSFS